MKRFKSLAQLKSFAASRPIGITFGNFDGMHRGHRRLLSSFEKKIKLQNWLGVIVTFSPHPFIYFHPNQRHLILSESDKEKKLLRFKNVVLLTLDFSQYQNMKMNQFIDQIRLTHLNLVYVHLGYDFVMGCDKKDPYTYFSASFESIEIAKEKVFHFHDEIVSSTLIRKLLIDGLVKQANIFLNDPFHFEGKVIHGKKLGRTIGYPTINIAVSKNQILPKNGVYIVSVKIKEGLFKGIMNLGVNPTVDENLNIKIEIHLLGFSSEIYGEKVEVFVLDFIRNEKKFESLDKLKDQIKIDIGTLDA